MSTFFSRVSVLFLLLASLFLQAQDVYTVENVPNPKNNDGGWIADPNNYLSLEEKAELNGIIFEIENKSTAQIAIVMLPSIGEEVPKEFAVKLFEKWGIGQAEKDNGLLILTVIDQRRTEFEVGYGLEPILTDALSYRIASQELVPHFKNANYGLGLIAGLTRIQEILNNPEVIEEIYDNGGVDYPKEFNYPYKYYLPEYMGLFGYFSLMVFALFYYFSKTRKINKTKDDFYDKFQDLKKMKHFIFMILFPLPFILIRILFTRNRLSKYRNHSRFSKKTGQEMFKKTDVTEDPFLQKGQLVEEKIRSMDYDVWVTEKGDDILILKYKKLFSKYSKCPKCNYKTYYTAHSKTVKAATKMSTGIRENTYLCKNCNYSKVSRTTIPKITSTSSSSSSYGGGSSSGGGSSFGGGSSGGGGAGVSW